jgi:hypothetical protein
MLRALRRACGLPEEGEIERGMGRPRRARRAEIEQEQMRRAAVEQRIREIEAKHAALCGPKVRNGVAFLCKQPPGHAGECFRTPPDAQTSSPSQRGDTHGTVTELPAGLTEPEAPRFQQSGTKPEICGEVYSGRGYYWLCQLEPGHTDECSPTPRDAQTFGLD